MSRAKQTAFFFIAGWSLCALADDLPIDDFEAVDLSRWTITGDAFGTQPAKGSLDGQMRVSGFQGEQLLNSFHGGDATTGTATSPSFAIARPYLAFRIGGGADEKRLAIRLMVDGDIVRSSVGSESEDLTQTSWDVRDLLGKKAHLVVVDEATGGWGHILIDDIRQTDEQPARFDTSAALATYLNSPESMNEPLRPQFHFTPPLNWMNDPNGLVFHDGEYHLFYQHNPLGNEWGHMSWGHAVSSDLVHWQQLPLAIPETDREMAFSGCCVVDHRNTAGFGTEDTPAMVAIYTGHRPGRQVQNLAYSLDNGRSWEVYEGNPVLDEGLADFRDPKVFWHDETGQWVMVVSRAIEKVLVFYGSENLKDWKELSHFGPAGAITKPNWECPDLFQLPLQAADGSWDGETTCWVLEADMGGGAVAGGSGSEYFVGEFDGVRFQAGQAARWVDYGRDFYAPVSFDNIPAADGRRIWIGWMNNWETSLVPTSPWRGAMSIPRSLAVRVVPFNSEEPAVLALVQQPVAELRQLRTETRKLASVSAWPPEPLTEPGELADMTFELEVEIEAADARSAGIRIRTGDEEFTEIGYDRFDAAVYVDRTRSGNTGFHPAFAGRHAAPARQIDGTVSLRIFVDRSSVEVFVNDGEAVITDRVFPTSHTPTIEAFTGGPTAEIRTTLHRLKSAWR